MKNILKNSIILFGYRLLFTLLAVGFFYSFANIASSQKGLLIYSCVTALLYLIAVYSFIWKTGKSDSKSGKFNILDGIVPMIIAEVITYIITFMHLVYKSDIITIIYRIYQFMYIGFISDASSQIFVLIPVFIAATIGYILGYKRFEIYDKIIMKLVYKTKKKDC